MPKCTCVLLQADSAKPLSIPREKLNICVYVCVCVRKKSISPSVMSTRIVISVHGILQARILQWVAIPFSRESSWPRNRTQVSRIVGRFFTIWATSKLTFMCDGGGLVAKSCLTLVTPMDCSLPDSSVHGIPQSRILEWVAISSSRGSSPPGIKRTSPKLQADSLPLAPPGKPRLCESRGKIEELFSLTAKSCLTLRSHGLQHARLPCSLLSPRVYSNSCPLNQWCHLTIAFSAALFFYLVFILHLKWLKA